MDAYESPTTLSYATAIGFSFMWTIGQAVLYKRYYLGVKPRYPLGVADQDDIYFPRFNIPRPLYLDERKRKKKEFDRQDQSKPDP